MKISLPSFHADKKPRSTSSVAVTYVLSKKTFSSFLTVTVYSVSGVSPSKVRSNVSR